MTFGTMCRAIYDLLSMDESDRQQSSITKDAVNTAQKVLAKIFPIITEATITGVSRVNSLPSDFLVDVMAIHSEFGDMPRDSKCKYASQKLIVIGDLIDTADSAYAINLIYGKVPAALINPSDVIEIEDSALDAMQALAMYLITKNESYNNEYQVLINTVMSKQDTLVDVETQREVVVDVMYSSNEIENMYR